MAKMFVNYSKSKAEFIAAGLESTYDKSVVFIGNGECVYTHGNYYATLDAALASLKYFTSISDGANTASAQAPNSTINFNTTNNKEITVGVGSDGVTVGLASDFITKVDTASTKASAAATQTALNEEIARATAAEQANAGLAVGLRTDVDAIKADYLKAADKTALQEYADQAEADAKAYTDGKVTEINTANSALETRVKANEDAIGVLNGADTVEGSVDKKVKDAINEFATNISDDDTINTFKELIDYAASHKNEYSTLSGEVQANTTAIATLNGTADQAGSVAKAVKDAVDAEATIARAAEKANADAIDAIEADYLKAADKTELNDLISAAQAKADANAEAIAALDFNTDNTSTGYVKNLFQTDGKVTATMVAAVPATDVSVSSTKVTSTTASAAIDELADMWAWEEL